MCLEKKSASDRAGPRVGRAIRVPQVRLIDEQGVMRGIIPIEDALRHAERVGMDLVEVDPQARPPVCKILDYGRLKYQEQKKKAHIRKNQRVVVLKEVQLRPNIQEHDYQVKLGNARRFLQEGNKLKISLQFHGREIMHQEIGRKRLDTMIADLAELGKPESDAKLEGRRIIVVVAPLKVIESGKAHETQSSDRVERTEAAPDRGVHEEG